MEKFKLVTKRNHKETKNQEFMVKDYSEVEKTKLEFDIIDEIEKGIEYKTKNSDGNFTLCEVGNRNTVKYLTSTPNGSTVDNINNLPTY